MEKEINKFLVDFIRDAERYTSHNGRVCFRQFAPLSWFGLKCRQNHFNVDELAYGLHYIARPEGCSFELEYCEGDIILSFDLKTYNKIKNEKSSEFVELSILGKNARLVNVSYSKEFDCLFGCWLQDGKNWEVLGYIKNN